MKLNLCSTAMTAFVAAMALAAPAHAYDWLQFNGDMQHSGNNTAEQSLNRNNVGRLLRKYQVALGGTSDAPAVFLEAVTTPGGTKDLLFVTTTAGNTLAINAQTGVQVWAFTPSVPACVHGSSTQCYTTSSPAIDPNRQFVYAYTLDGKVRKLAVGTGVESGAPWPITTSNKPYDEKNASALAFATSGDKTYLYVVAGGYPGDSGDYQGHVTTIDLATGSKKVFNTMCSDQAVLIASGGCRGGVQSAVWARPGVVYSAATNRIYFGTGNGQWTGTTKWSESVLALKADGSGVGTGPVDSYTPTNQPALDSADADLGSTAPVILPTPSTSTYLNLALQGGKDAKVRLVNLDNLSGTGAPGAKGGEIGGVVDFSPGGGIFGQPATWVDHATGTTWAYVANGSGTAAYKLVIAGNGTPSLVEQWTVGSGHSPLVVNGVLINQRGGLRAHDPVTNAPLWSTSRIGGQHWQSPIVANGVLYAPDNSGNLNAFANGGAGLRVDLHTATGSAGNLNGVLEPGESVVVEPGWRNVTAASIALTGTATSVTGPAGATYTIADNSAAYGTLAADASGDCFSAGGNCYRVNVSAPATRPVLHWDVKLAETLSTTDTASLVLHVGHTFTDVPDSYALYTAVETLAHNNVTLGFGDGTFQPDAGSVRGATALFVARGLRSPNGNSAIAPTGKVGGNAYACRAGGTSLFTDVPATANYCAAVHMLAAAGVNIAFGCDATTQACPVSVTTREAMSVIVAGSLAGSDAAVPASGSYGDSGSTRSYNCTSGSSHFPDVEPASATCRHINYLWARGVISGFVDGTFQPNAQVTRGQIAKFITNGMHLTLY